MTIGESGLSQEHVDMDQKSRRFQKSSKEHGLSKLLKKRKMKIFKTKKRFDHIRGIMSRHAEITRAHHLRHYGVERLKWEWGSVDHLGVWAYGGEDKNKPPILKDVCIQVPKSVKVNGWWCYVGPILEFE